MGRRAKSGRKSDKSIYRSLVLVTQFGINMLVPIGMMSALGVWLDRRFDTSFWTILLFFAGAAAGAQNIYRMAKQIYNVKDDVKEKKEPGSAHEDNRDTEKQE